MIHANWLRPAERVRAALVELLAAPKIGVDEALLKYGQAHPPIS